MKRVVWLAGACLLGGVLVMAVTRGVRTPARAAEGAATVTHALDVVINEVAWA